MRLTETLEALRGVLPHAFASLAEALAWGDANRIDAFLIAVAPDRADATADILEIRTNPLYEWIPVLVVLGAHQAHARSKAYLDGVDDVFVRPFVAEELTVRLGRRLVPIALQRDTARECSRLRQTLDEHDLRSAAQRKRIETLWRLANEAASSHPDFVQTMVEKGAKAIRPDAIFHGSITRIEGDEVVVVFSTARKYIPERAQLEPNFRFPIAGTMVEQTARFGMTRTWSDLQADPTITSTNVHDYGWRSALCAPFQSLGDQYFLTFVSEQLLPGRFTSEDHAYCDLLATFFASHFQQQWQRERLTFHTAHDPLTGTLNSVHFRSQARIGMIDAPAYALVVVELIDYAGVNKAHGFQTGDALLVEVAIELQRRALPAERVGRLSSQGFGLFIPAPENGTTIDDRIAEFRSVFPRGFSTGDREGRDFVTLDAGIGVARSGVDGTTFDVLLSHADAEARAVSHR